MTTTATIEVCPAAELPPGDSRIVEVDGRKIGVFNCDGDAVRDRGPLLPRRRAARRGPVRSRAPAPSSARATAPCSTCAPAGRVPCPPTFPSRPFPSASRTAPSSWRFPDMATPEIAVATPDDLDGHQGLLRVRLPRLRDGLRLQGEEGPQPPGRRGDLRPQGRAAVDARLPPEGARALREPARCPSGPAGTWTRSTSRTSTTSCAPPRSRAAPGTRSPTTSRTRSTSSASPRPSGSTWPASARSTSPRSSTTRSARTSRSRA